MTFIERVKSIINISWNIKLEEKIQIEIKALLEKNPKDKTMIKFLKQSTSKSKRLEKKMQQLVDFKEERNLIRKFEE